MVISVISWTRFSAPRRLVLEELNIVDDHEVEALLALEPAGAGGKLRDRQAAGLVDIERHALHLAGGADDRGELVLGDAAAADVGGGDSRPLGDNAGGELLGRHFERE